MECPHSALWCGMLIAWSHSNREGKLWNSLIQVHDVVCWLLDLLLTGRGNYGMPSFRSMMWYVDCWISFWQGGGTMQFSHSGPWCGMLIAGSPSDREVELCNSLIQIHDVVCWLLDPLLTGRWNYAILSFRSMMWYVDCWISFWQGGGTMQFPHSAPWCGMLIVGSPSNREGDLWNSLIQLYDVVCWLLALLITGRGNYGIPSFRSMIWYVDCWIS